MWTLSKSCLKPDGTYCIMTAQQWVMKQGLPFSSAVDKAREAKLERRVSISPSGQKLRSSSGR